MQKDKNQKLSMGEIVIYRAKDGSARLEAKLEKETIWLTQMQISQLFNVGINTINYHIKEIFKIKELDENSTIRKIRIVQKEGKREVAREVIFYNLDIIISVGYRVNSKRATEFRIWATQVLKKYIVNGVAVNQKRLRDQKINLQELGNAIKLLQNTIDSKKITGSEAQGLLQVITEYANSWLLLNKYDTGKIKVAKGKTAGIKSIDYPLVDNSIKKLKQALIKKKQASDLFGQDIGHRLESILNAINQSFANRQLYPSLEEKAAHLLYFIIKDHPFVDGNKRIGSLLFILFLQQNNYLLNKKSEKKINANALVALALLVAQSKPQDKNVMVALITNFIKK